MSAVLREAQARVRDNWPDAYAYNWHSEWTVYAARIGAAQGICLGTGPTRISAWVDAAARLKRSNGGGGV